ncbi:hypothetical protein SOM26_17080 [Sphingomonas sp. CFBP8993]|nr:hypothetical protein [Sphingomonas sp. CFBP8993]MDY0960399.1 hypothetical protein [Sphingomonas sp. CFBP8993]
MRHEQFLHTRDPARDTHHGDRGPMLGIVNGMLGSLAIWALIAGVVVVAS